jgi:hypothetical protein
MMRHEPCRACVLLIAFVVPNSVGIVVQVRNRTLAETTTTLQAMSIETWHSRVSINSSTRISLAWLYQSGHCLLDILPMQLTGGVTCKDLLITVGEDGP